MADANECLTTTQFFRVWQRITDDLCPIIFCKDCRLSSPFDEQGCEIHHLNVCHHFIPNIPYKPLPDHYLRPFTGIKRSLPESQRSLFRPNAAYKFPWRSHLPAQHMNTSPYRRPTQRRTQSAYRTHPLPISTTSSYTTD